MEIEIITTKRKLSKSVVKQLELATVADMTALSGTDRAGYYVRDIGASYPSRVGVFAGVNGWVILPIRDWKACGKSRAECKALKGFGVSVREFSSTKERDSWLSSYDAAKEKCLKNHLIL